MNSLLRPQTNYRADIDGLRAIAVVMVVVFHAFPSQLGGGFIGVDIFFVISGFLITNILINGLKENKFDLVNFYCRRIQRIFPALIVVLAACFTFGWFNLLADEYKQLGKHIGGGASFSSNFILLSESGYFDASSISKPLLHLWSLAIEEQFYLLWPVLLWIGWRLHLNLAFVTLFLFCFSFLTNLYTLQFLAGGAPLFYLPQNRFWELMLGGLLAYQPQFFSKQLKGLVFPASLEIKNALSIAGLGLVALGALFISEHSMYPGYWALIPTAGVFLIISAGPDAWINRKFLSHPAVVWVGLISFPLYLWHWPILSFLHIISVDEPSNLYKSMGLLFSLLLAVCTYYFVEKFFRFGPVSLIKVFILIALLSTIGFVGYNTYVRDGLTFRLNQVQFRLPIALQKLGEKYIKPPEDSLNPAENDIKKDKIFLWGDSYAEHLLVGYKKTLGEKYQIENIGIQGCPPILKLDIAWRKGCSKSNEDKIEKIKNEWPERLVLAANWTDYDWRQVQVTIDELRRIGYDKIEIVGPAPQWRESLYKQLYLNYLATKDENIPYRMNFGLNNNFLEIEPQLKAIAIKNKINYLSIVDVLCNNSGCITRFGEDSRDLASFDGGHLTSAASIYVVSRFYKSK